MSVLQVSHVCREYRQGKAQVTQALRDVSLSIGAGEVLGLVGVNGAGKTTLTKICSTLLAPTSVTNV